MKDEFKKICKEALETWGEQAQLLMVVEEMAELQKEILKNINRKQNNIENIIGETADVYIMLEQLKQNYNIEKAVEEQIEKKLKEVVKIRLAEWNKK
ncbi:MAG: hypothetical protein LBR70_02020 [Lactobacillaceae bacterium]|jgi:NTP pyrophosphatase (non-canonical NTP hydrolase)|nr:hypothetical protein [Lactobacillaceae bacterium]